MTITVYPEMAAAVLKNREADLYVLWAVLRAMDQQSTGSGLVSVGDMIDVCASLLGIQSNHAYRKIEAGVDKYWRRPAGDRGRKTMGLLGQGKVLSRLDITMTRAEPFVIPAAIFRAEEDKKNGRAVKQILIGVVAARFVDHRPVSVATVMEQTGQSESTIRIALRDCPHVVKYANYEVLYTTTSRPAAAARQRALHAQGVPCCLQHDKGSFLVLRRIANTYLFPEPDRKPLRTRPRELRRYDLANALQASEKRYHRGEHPDPTVTNHLKRIGLETHRAEIWGRLDHPQDLPQSRAGKAAACQKIASEQMALEN